MQVWREELVLWLSTLGFDDWRLTVLAVLVMVSIVAVLSAARNLALFLFKTISKTSYYDHVDFWYNLIKRLRLHVAIALGLAVASLFIPLSPVAGRLVDTILLLLLTFLLFSLIQATIFDFVTYMVKYFPSHGEKKVDRTAITFFKVVVGIVLWLVAVIVILRAWDYDITMLLGGLGVASIIISFSAQNFLKDIFAFFTIYADKSFSVGDYIMSGTYEGTVREIRLRTTRITAPSGQELLIANNILIEQTLSNFSHLPARRVSLDLFFNTATPPAKIERVLVDIKALFKPDDELVEFGYVHFREMKEESFVITLVYYYHRTGYVEYLDQREKLNLDLVRIFVKHGVKFTSRYKVLKGEQLA